MMPATMATSIDNLIDRSVNNNKRKSGPPPAILPGNIASAKTQKHHQRGHGGNNVSQKAIIHI